MNDLRKKRLILPGIPAVFLITFFMLPVILSNCGNVLGFGDPVDWEPPVLTLDNQDDPKYYPLYVNKNTRLSGTVTDNVGVDRVVCRDADTGTLIGRATITGDIWTMNIDVNKVQSGEKIHAEIVAFDRAGNSGDVSMVSLVMIVDKSDPRFTEVLLWRMANERSTRTSSLEINLNDLVKLQNADEDPLGKSFANVNKYQNGAFWIRARTEEDDTTIDPDSLGMHLYYVLDNATRREALILPRNLEGIAQPLPNESSSVYAPEWTIREGDLADWGDGRSELLVGGRTVRQRLEAGDRLYFRVAVSMHDLALNAVVEENVGYFCLWRNADEPKSIMGGGNNIQVNPGVKLTVDIFDDDEIEFAFVDLMTVSQFNSYSPGGSDLEKLQGIRTKLGSDPASVTNWRKQPGNPSRDGTGFDPGTERITNRIITPIDRTIVTLDAGKDSVDYGEYRLVVLLGDIKDKPHDPADPNTRADQVLHYEVFTVYISDNNAALIVIDTVDTKADDYNPGKHPGNEGVGNPASTGDSPEENTFPILDQGRYFTIQGYTLDENSKNTGGVAVFRIAWIPYTLDAADPDALQKVKNALQYEVADSRDDPALASANPYPAGVQHWTLSNFTNPAATPNSYFITGAPQSIGGTDNYKKQVFKKRFDILGGKIAADTDDLNTSYKNFRYNPSGGTDLITHTRENAPKLFVLYARDTDRHHTFRTIRLLGNTTPPLLTVYDGTSKGTIPGLTAPTPLPSNPNQAQVDADELAQKDLYPDIKGGYTFTDDDILGPFTRYPLDTKFTLFAKIRDSKSSIGIKEIVMHEVTNGPAAPINKRGWYSELNQDLTYMAQLGDLQQRVFEFSAVNDLDVSVTIQRTVAITATAYLEDIISPWASGTYGRLKSDGTQNKVPLEAHFSGQVTVPVKTPQNKPLLNVRYETAPGVWVYDTADFVGVPGQKYLYLPFEYTIKEDANGLLETIWNYDSGDPSKGNGDAAHTMPINLNGSDVRDADRDEPAFLPGIKYNWTDQTTSLQGSKNIRLDGKPPTILSFVVSDKAVYKGEPNTRYYNASETIAFTLLASKHIRTSGAGNPRIEFRIGSNTYYADYYRPTKSNPVLTYTDGMIFIRDVAPRDSNGNPIPGMQDLANGELVFVGLNTTGGGIEDPVGNPLVNTRDASNHDIFYQQYSGNVIRVDTIAPLPVTAATPRFDGAVYNGTGDYGVEPVLTVPGTVTNEPWGVSYEYSLDGGTSWLPRGTPQAPGSEQAGSDVRIKDGEWKLKTRLVDKAGNITEPATIYDLSIKSKFPRIEAVRAETGKGIHTEGDLIFWLDFEYEVKTGSTSSAYILVSSINTVGSDQTDPSKKVTAKIPVVPNTVLDTKLKFVLKDIDLEPLVPEGRRKQMYDGLTVTEIHLNGDVVDKYNHAGVNSYPPTSKYVDDIDKGEIIMWKIAGEMTGTYTPNTTQLASDTDPHFYRIDNLNGIGIEVLTIPPTLQSSEPANAQGNTTNTPSYVLGGDRKTITLTFDENVYREMGTIVISPRWDSDNAQVVPIPPVLTTDEFYSAYNSSYLTDTDRKILVGSDTNMAWNTNGRTGLYVGPYVLTTQGLLKNQPGYSGNITAGTNYNVNSSAASAGWTPSGSSYLVPDTSPKFVLAYGYNASHTTETVTGFTVTANQIRDTLKKARFRWREIDVMSSTVSTTIPYIQIGTTGNLNAGTGNVVTINLINPLPEGLKWELFFRRGTFVSKAGLPVEALGRNPAPNDPVIGLPAEASGTPFWFWTTGVKTPVIRVQRRSADHRVADTSPDFMGTKMYMAAPAAGYNVSDLDTVNFKIECETPGATVTYAKLEGTAANSATAAGTLPNAAITIPSTGTGTSVNWTVTGNIRDGANNNSTPVFTWNGIRPSPVNDTHGTWILPNLVRRAASTTAGLLYDQYKGTGTYWGLRSYNKDAEEGDFPTTLNLSVTSASPQGTAFNFQRFTASKNYVVAQATRVHPNMSPANPASQKGYEGVFRTIVALNSLNSSSSTSTPPLNNSNGSTPVHLYGSNSISPAPSIPGFPLRLETSDHRFTKLPFRQDGNQIYWITTEIVSPVFFRFACWDSNGTVSRRPFQQYGDVDCYISGGYGDLSYSYNQDVGAPAGG